MCLSAEAGAESIVKNLKIAHEEVARVCEHLQEEGTALRTRLAETQSMLQDAKAAADEGARLQMVVEVSIFSSRLAR